MLSVLAQGDFVIPPSDTRATASSTGELIEPLPPPELEAPPLGLEADAPLLSTVSACDSVAEVKQPKHVSLYALDKFWGYRLNQSWVSWIVGNGQQYGDFSLVQNQYLDPGVRSGLCGGLAIHWLAGPDSTDMPPMLFDLQLGYQRRDIIGDLAYDLACSVLVASDFEGSSHEGIRFPAHAVGYLAFTDTVDLVFGVDFLDRDDVRLLPVGGLLWRPDPALRVELVFPAPRIDFQLTDSKRLYLRGGLGGGTWSVERDSELDDLATYRDLQVAIGVDSMGSENHWEAFEIAYLFDRRLEYRYGPGDCRFNSTVMLRSVSKF